MRDASPSAVALKIPSLRFGNGIVFFSLYCAARRSQETSRRESEREFIGVYIGFMGVASCSRESNEKYHGNCHGSWVIDRDVVSVKKECMERVGSNQNQLPVTAI